MPLGSQFSILIQEIQLHGDRSHHVLLRVEQHIPSGKDLLVTVHQLIAPHRDLHGMNVGKLGQGQGNGIVCQCQGNARQRAVACGKVHYRPAASGLQAQKAGTGWDGTFQPLFRRAFQQLFHQPGRKGLGILRGKIHPLGG